MASNSTRPWWANRFFMLMTMLSTGTFGGWMKSDLPILGPLVHSVLGSLGTDGTDGNGELGELISQIAPATGYAPRTASGGANVFPQQARSPQAGYPPGQYPQTQYPQTGYPQQDQYPPNAYPAAANPNAGYPNAGYPNAGYGNPAAAQARPPATAQLASARQTNDRIRIATFNIQVFGESKMGKPDVVEILAQTCRQFDLIAIQEVRAQSDEILPRFVRAINADGSQYSFIIGERIGRTVSTEQYVFVFNTQRIEHDRYAMGTMADPQDKLHREPFVARFRARTSSPQNAFTFWMVNTHTDPDEVPEEVAALADVFQVMQRARADEDDVILLGDLNADETQMGPIGQIPGIGWVVRGAMTNTRQTKAYDNIIFHRGATSEYTGRWGVVDMEQAFGITREQALKVSDHLPVWAEFSVWESRR